MSKTFEAACVEQALDKLFTKSYFDICTLNDIAKLLKAPIKRSPEYKFLSALHCVSYADMLPEVKQELQQRVVACLRPDGMVPAAVLTQTILAEGNDFGNYEDRAIGTYRKVQALPKK